MRRRCMSLQMYQWARTTTTCRRWAAGREALARRAAGAPLFAEVLDLVLLDVRVVLVEGRRERVRPVVLADEIHVAHVRGGGGGLERGAPRRGDRARRQARVAIGVVRRVEVQVIAAQVAVVPSGPLER